MIIDATAYRQMIDHMRQAAPHEGVGLLAGPLRAHCPRDTDGDGDCGRRLCPYCGGDGSTERTCDRWVPLDNVAEHPRVRYEVDNTALLDAWNALDTDGGRRPWIMCHSHVTGTTTPSEVDILYAHDQTLRHLVVSLAGTEPVTRLWNLNPFGHGANRAVRALYEVVDLGIHTVGTTDLTSRMSEG